MFLTIWCYATVVAACVVAGLAIYALRYRYRASRMALAFVLAAMLIALAGAVLFAFQSNAAIERRQMRATYELVRTVTRLGSAVAHAESGQRGYLLTLDAKYLATYTAATEKVERESRNLTRQVEDDADLRDLCKLLVSRIGEKSIEMRQVLDALKQRGFRDSLAIVQTNAGLKLEAEIDSTIERIRSQAQGRLTTFFHNDDLSETRIGLVSGGLLTLAILAIALASYLSSRQEGRRARERAELETRNEMLALAGEMANIGHWTLSSDGKVYWSEQVYRIHGLEPTDPLPLLDAAIDFFVPEDRSKVAANVQQALATGAGFQFEARLRRPNGQIADIISRGICEKDFDGKASSLFGMVIDVTAIRESERLVRRNERLYRLLAENVTDVLVKYDQQNRFTYVSPSSARLLGRTPGALVGTSLVDLVHPEDREAVAARLSAWQPVDGTSNDGIEYRLQHADGGWIWVEANACHYVDDEDGDVSIAMIRDFRRRKAVEDALAAALKVADEARAGAESANKAKSDFLAAMSHEIRTPLNSIIGFTGLMLDNRRLVGDLRHQTEIVRSSGSALLTVINDILDFSKIEAGMIEIEKEPFSPRVLFANVMSIVRGMAISKSLDIVAAIPDSLPDGLLGDQNRLQQVLLNLLNNAVKFTAQGSVTLDVRIESDDVRGVKLRLAVTDTGMGIEKSKQNRLFQRFSQADASVSRRFGGSGLGLAISKRLVELMGGEIGVVSDEGRGSTFWLTLDLPRARVETLGNDGEAVVGAAGRLLLAEDIEVNQLLARTLLEADGHSVDIVASGEAAIEAVQRKIYDLVLMDVQMPGIGGVAAAQAIRALPGMAKLPIIAMTANVLTEQVREFRAAGMDDHVGKPIDRKDLRAKLAHWLDPARTGAELETAFDAQTFDVMAQLLGEKKTQETLAKFLRELETRLAANDLAVDGRIAFQRDAHVVTSIAGLLGFKDLAQSCAAVTMLAAEEGEVFERTGTDVLRAKDHAAAHVRSLMASSAALTTAA